MDVHLLIDSIVRQTTVMIAQLATSAGVRAPLAHIANETFLSLVRELSSQGVSHKVIADMFGMALSSYHQKVRRLSESETDRGKTLWQAVYGYLQECEKASRSELLHRFRRDSPDSVAAVLADLVATGLAYRSGRGRDASFRIRPQEEIESDAGNGSGTAQALVLVTVFRTGPLSRRALSQLTSLPNAVLDQVLSELVDEGRVRVEEVDGAKCFSAGSLLIPLGDSLGWEAALFDHYQALVVAVCQKLDSGRNRSASDDSVGGSTFTFHVWPEHPFRERVIGLLREQRERLASLWDEIGKYNREHGEPEHMEQVTFYFGQYGRGGEADPP